MSNNCVQIGKRKNVWIVKTVKDVIIGEVVAMSENEARIKAMQHLNIPVKLEYSEE